MERYLDSAIVLFVSPMILRYLLALIILTLPFNGWAGARVAEPCPMAASAMADHTTTHAPCCEEDAKPGKALSDPCKPGQQCQSGAVYFASPFAPATPAPLAAQPVLPLDLHIAATAPPGVWRPPRV
jgi:hypothetical protein